VARRRARNGPTMAMVDGRGKVPKRSVEGRNGDKRSGESDALAQSVGDGRTFRMMHLLNWYLL